MSKSTLLSRQPRYSLSAPNTPTKTGGTIRELSNTSGNNNVCQKSCDTCSTVTPSCASLNNTSEGANFTPVLRTRNRRQPIKSKPYSGKVTDFVDCEHCPTAYTDSLDAWMDHLFAYHRLPNNWPSTRSASIQDGHPYTTVVGSQKKRKPDAIPRPLNSFMIFAQYIRRATLRRFPEAHNARISRRVGLLWRQLDKSTREEYAQEAIRLQDLHSIEYPEYKFQPKKRVRGGHHASRASSSNRPFPQQESISASSNCPDGEVQDESLRPQLKRLLELSADHRGKYLPIRPLTSAGSTDTAAYSFEFAPNVTIDASAAKFIDVNFGVFACQSVNPFLQSSSETSRPMIWSFSPTADESKATLTALVLANGINSLTERNNTPATDCHAVYVDGSVGDRAGALERLHKVPTAFSTEDVNASVTKPLRVDIQTIGSTSSSLCDPRTQKQFIKDDSLNPRLADDLDQSVAYHASVPLSDFAQDSCYGHQDAKRLQYTPFEEVLKSESPDGASWRLAVRPDAQSRSSFKTTMHSWIDDSTNTSPSVHSSHTLTSVAAESAQLTPTPGFEDIHTSGPSPSLDELGRLVFLDTALPNVRPNPDPLEPPNPLSTLSATCVLKTESIPPVSLTHLPGIESLLFGVSHIDRQS
ncbi:unnamed protein product [Dicrocoelium dendriticum]|nr:unnamed protein product [Dicrocoelium dendriticum]